MTETPGDARLSRCDKCGVVAPLDPPADGIHQGCGGHVEYLRSPGDARRLLDDWRRLADEHWDGGPGCSEVWRNCADELEAALSSEAEAPSSHVAHVKEQLDAFPVHADGTVRIPWELRDAAPILLAEAEAPRPHPVLLEIAGLVNSYHNDGSTRTAAETLAAIAHALGEPMSAEAPRLNARYLHDVADRIIEMDGYCAHNWLVAVAKHVKAALRQEAEAPPRPAEAAEVLAQRFHEAYERLAPQFGYQTREASAKPWADVPEQNKRLMVAVCAELFPAEAAPAGLRERLLSQAEYMETGGPFGAVPRVVETDSDVWRTAIALLLEAEQEITRLREALAKERQTEKTKT